MNTNGLIMNSTALSTSPSPEKFTRQLTRLGVDMKLSLSGKVFISDSKFYQAINNMSFAGIIKIEESKIMCPFTSNLEFSDPNFNIKKVVLDSCLIPNKDKLIN